MNFAEPNENRNIDSKILLRGVKDTGVNIFVTYYRSISSILGLRFQHIIRAQWYHEAPPIVNQPTSTPYSGDTKETCIKGRSVDVQPICPSANKMRMASRLR